MKKEWVYFIAGAGAGLIATVIFFSMPKSVPNSFKMTAIFNP